MTHNRLHYSHATETGALFHMIGALSQYGKVGLTAIGGSPEEADQIFGNAIAVLDAFDKPCSRESAAERLPGLDRKSVFRCIRELRKLRLLLSERESAKRVSFLQAWNRNLASASVSAAVMLMPSIT